MSALLECKKIKRSGFLPALLCGGILAAAVPIINMAVRSELYLAAAGSPIQILLGANWQMMAMLNVLLVVAGACLLYHTEYEDRAMRKMRSLPMRESAVFLGKMILTILVSFFVFVIEAGAVAFCSYRWFEIGDGYWSELCRYFGYSFLLVLPCAILSLFISGICENMWISLGVGVICVFTATMLPENNFILSLFPFAMPFRVFEGTDITQSLHYICAAAGECIVFGVAEVVFIKIRRMFE